MLVYLLIKKHWRPLLMLLCSLSVFGSGFYVAMRVRPLPSSKPLNLENVTEHYRTKADYSAALKYIEHLKRNAARELRAATKEDVKLAGVSSVQAGKVQVAYAAAESASRTAEETTIPEPCEVPVRMWEKAVLQWKSAYNESRKLVDARGKQIDGLHETLNRLTKLNSLNEKEAKLARNRVARVSKRRIRHGVGLTVGMTYTMHGQSPGVTVGYTVMWGK